MAAKKKAARKVRPVDGDSRKVDQSPVSAEARPTKSKEGRRKRRMKRGSVGGLRDILTVHWKDESDANEYITRWVKDTDERGANVMAMTQRDWDLVSADEVEVGETFVYSAGKLGSIVRVPAGKATEDAKHSLYLMKKYRDWAEEDEAIKQRRVDDMEAYIDRKRNPDRIEKEGEGYELEGMYGQAKTDWQED